MQILRRDVVRKWTRNVPRVERVAELVRSAEPVTRDLLHPAHHLTPLQRSLQVCHCRETMQKTSKTSEHQKVQRRIKGGRRDTLAGAETLTDEISRLVLVVLYQELAQHAYAAALGLVHGSDRGDYRIFQEPAGQEDLIPRFLQLVKRREENTRVSLYSSGRLKCSFLTDQELSRNWSYSLHVPLLQKRPLKSEFETLRVNITTDTNTRLYTSHHFFPPSSLFETAYCTGHALRFGVRTWKVPEAPFPVICSRYPFSTDLCRQFLSTSDLRDTQRNIWHIRLQVCMTSAVQIKGCPSRSIPDTVNV